MKITNELGQIPEPSLRQKYDYSKHESELSVFKSIALEDPWEDACLPAVYWYVAKNKKVQIPPAWKQTMSEFNKELRAVACLNCTACLNWSTLHPPLLGSFLLSEVNMPDPFGIGEGAD